MINIQIHLETPRSPLITFPLQHKLIKSKKKKKRLRGITPHVHLTPRSHKTPSASESMSGNVGRCVFFRMFYWPTSLYRYYLWSVFELLSGPPEQDLSVHRMTSFPLWPCILMLYMSRLGRLFLWACASFCFIVPQLHDWRPLWKIFHWASPCPVLIYDSWALQIFSFLWACYCYYLREVKRVQKVEKLILMSFLY